MAERQFEDNPAEQVTVSMFVTNTGLNSMKILLAQLGQ